MDIREKITAIAGICGPTIDPIEVRTRTYLLGCIPISRFDSKVWIAEQDDHWRVMLSSDRRMPVDSQIVGVEFLKSDGAARSWDYFSKHWELADRSAAAAIRERVRKAIDLAYDQSQVKPNPLRKA